MEKKEQLRVAAIALLQNKEGKYASLWNDHFKGFTLPGGKVNENENIYDALYREVREELGVSLIEYGLHSVIWEEWIDDHDNIPKFIVIFYIGPYYGGIPKSVEGNELRWMTQEELCDSKLCPFYNINKKMFERIRLREILGL